MEEILKRKEMLKEPSLRTDEVDVGGGRWLQ